MSDTQDKQSTLLPESNTAFIYLDESGDFNFSPTGTKYFILTCMVTTDPSCLPRELLPIKYECVSGKIPHRIKDHKFQRFHATDDNYTIRERVFAALSAHSNHQGCGCFQVYSVIMQKNKANPSIRDDFEFYPKVFEMLTGYVLERGFAASSDKVIFITDTLPTKKEGRVNQALKAHLNKWAARTKKTYRLHHHQSASDLNLQAVDYLSWAIYRKWERGDNEAYDLISKAIIGEADLFERGTTTYYEMPKT